MARGRASLLKAVDAKKDQSYFLWGINRRVLSRMLLPVGSQTKPETRAVAHRLDDLDHAGHPCRSLSVPNIRFDRPKPHRTTAWPMITVRRHQGTYLDRITQHRSGAVIISLGFQDFPRAGFTKFYPSNNPACGCHGPRRRSRCNLFD